MICRASTGSFLRNSQAAGSDSGFRWSGPDGEPRVTCAYEARDGDAMLCHLLATHAMTLDAARRQLAAWIIGGKVAV